MDNELAPLEPVVERAGSTSTYLAHHTFGSRLGEVAQRMMKTTLLFRGDWLSESELHYPIVKGGRLVSER